MTIEKSSRFGAIDSDALTDGQPVSAHILREMGRTTNFMIAKPQPVYQAVFNKSIGIYTPNGEVSDSFYYASQGRLLVDTNMGAWRYAVQPINTPKVPGHTDLLVKMRGTFTSGTWYAHVQTYGNSNIHEVSNENTIRFTGSGENTFISITGTVKARVESGERIGILFRKDMNIDDDALMNTGTMGSPATGTLAFALNGRWFFASPPASWVISTGSTISPIPFDGHYLVVWTNSNKSTISLSPSPIVDAGEHYNSVSYIDVPNPYGAEQNFFSMMYFEIHRTPRLRLTSISIYSQERAF